MRFSNNIVSRGKSVFAIVSALLILGISWFILRDVLQLRGLVITFSFAFLSLVYGLRGLYFLKSKGSLSKPFFNTLGYCAMITGFVLAYLGVLHIYSTLSFIAAYLFYTMEYYPVLEGRLRFVVILLLGMLATILLHEKSFNLEFWNDFEHHNTVEIVSALVVGLTVGGVIQITRVVTEREIRQQLHVGREREVMVKLNKILAHNIRGPVAEISMRSEIAQLKGDNSLVQIQPALEKLLSITDELFKYNTDTNDQGLTINELCKSLKAVFGNDVVLEIHLHENYRMEEGRVLMYALQNFIANAIKFSDEPPELKILKSKGELVFSVSDAGLGMSPSQLERLGTPVRSQTGGLGMGLMLSIELLKAYGYHLRVASKSSEGTIIALSKEAFALKDQCPTNWPQIAFRALEFDLKATLL